MDLRGCMQTKYLAALKNVRTNWRVGREIYQMTQFWLHFNTNDLAKARKEQLGRKGRMTILTDLNINFAANSWLG